MKNYIGDYNLIDRPVVSIWCLTFNHVEYIEDTLEGFLSQKTNFQYEIVIHDDASTDGTTYVLKKYKEKYPDRIKLVIEEKNIYNRNDRDDILSDIKKRMLTGKYIAFCEGDDQWIDVNKLQKQVDFLESHEDYMMVSHNAMVRNCITDEMKLQNKNYKSDSVNVKDIILQNRLVLHTSTIMCKRDVLHINEIFSKYSIGDWLIKLFCAANGKIYYMEDVMSVYRYMHNGSWSQATNSDIFKYIKHRMEMIDLLMEFNQYTDGKYIKWINIKVNMFVDSILAKTKEIEMGSLCTIYREINNITDKKYVSSIRKLLLLKMKRNKYNLDEDELKCFAANYKEIYVWGTGKNSELCSIILEKLNISVCGYIVTKMNKGINLFRGKKVYEIDQFSCKNEKIGIIVAVRNEVWSEIFELIEEKNISNFYYVYDYKLLNDRVI